MKPNVPSSTNTCANRSLFSVKSVKTSLRSWRRTARRGTTAAAATTTYAVRLLTRRGAFAATARA
jgi:hypothetical protein